MKAARAALVMITAVVALAAAGPAGAALTERVSVATGGAQGNNNSLSGDMTPNGRYVAFHSFASNLVTGDTNGRTDIFLRDRRTGITKRVNVASDGTQSNHESFDASITPDGRYVAFESFASNLVTGDGNGTFDVFVHDTQTGQTERVSVATGGSEGNDESHVASISADGRYVAFDSEASNLVPGDTNGLPDVFVRDRQNDTTDRVSVAIGGGETDGSSSDPALTPDGRYVAFTSLASNLVAGDGDNNFDVFVHDTQTGDTERVSMAPGGGEADGSASQQSISDDGRYVAFESTASNLVSGDNNDDADIFVRDRQADTTKRVSVATGSGESNDISFMPSISADGRHVAFSSFATNLVTGDTNGEVDVFAHDRQTGTTERVSVKAAGGQANGLSVEATISPDGSRVLFSFFGTNLVPGDTNGSGDVFIRHRTATMCSDGTDNDGDALVDFPDDQGCTSLADTSEVNPQCIDGRDNDNDGATDFPADLGCASPASNIENPQCSDGQDNDNDGVTDHPNDPGCTSAADNSEINPQCNDGLDNDNDGATDHPNDPGCTSLADNNETNAQCNDNQDNDNDGATDFPGDPGCASLADNSEINPQCNDGKDNDNDGAIDYPADAGCTSLASNIENPQCSDGRDNDNDGVTDSPGDPGCTSAADNSEINPQCNDNQDNDNDGVTDFPGDPGCASLADNNETNPQCNDGLDNDNDGVTDHPNDPGCTSLADNSEVNPQCNDGKDNDNDGATDFPGDLGCKNLTDNSE